MDAAEANHSPLSIGEPQSSLPTTSEQPSPVTSGPSTGKFTPPAHGTPSSQLPHSLPHSCHEAVLSQGVRPPLPPVGFRATSLAVEAIPIPLEGLVAQPRGTFTLGGVGYVDTSPFDHIPSPPLPSADLRIGTWNLDGRLLVVENALVSSLAVLFQYHQLDVLYYRTSGSRNHKPPILNQR
jgi:hypothetical protein